MGVEKRGSSDFWTNKVFPLRFWTTNKWRWTFVRIWKGKSRNGVYRLKWKDDEETEQCSKYLLDPIGWLFVGYTNHVRDYHDPSGNPYENQDVPIMPRHHNVGADGYLLNAFFQLHGLRFVWSLSGSRQALWWDHPGSYCMVGSCGKLPWTIHQAFDGHFHHPKQGGQW